MITKEIVLRLHELSIQQFSGAKGIRDEGLMESAIARPYQTFGGEDLYSTVLEKAAAIEKVSLLIIHLLMVIKERAFLPCLLYWKQNK
jgi:death on curing protein